MRLFKVAMYLFWLEDWVSGDDPTFSSLDSVAYVLAQSKEQAVEMLYARDAEDSGVKLATFRKRGIESIVEIDLSKAGVL